MQIRTCILLLASVLLFACSDSYYIDKWQGAKTAEERIDAAEAIVDRKLLLNLSREKVVAMLGPGKSKRNSITYLLHRGRALQPLNDPITVIILLVCDFDSDDRVKSCVIQKD